MVVPRRRRRLPQVVRIVTDDELKGLAKDMWAGHVFTSGQISRPEDLTMVFVPLGLMGQQQLDELIERIGDEGLIYQYVSEAGPMGINGNPVFYSFRILTSDEVVKVRGYLTQISEAMDQI